MLSDVTQVNLYYSLESLGEDLAYLGTPNFFVIGNLVPNGRDLIPKHTEEVVPTIQYRCSSVVNKDL